VRRAAPVRYPDAVRPWQHVLDPLAGYLELAERLASEGARFAEPWNFGPDESGAASVRQLAEQFALQWGEGAGWEADRRPQPREAALLRLDASKARQRLGWRPTWDFAHALERSVAWYKAQARGADMRGMTLDQIAEFERARAPAIQPG
jgi:CDP-glucose 4,6-dehydratase